MKFETWKAISGYEGLYEVSDQGRVRSLDREQTIANRWGGFTTRVLRGVLLKGSVFSNGYVGIKLGREGPMYLIHRLVALAFIPNPDGLQEVNHKNLVRDDNRCQNLEWITSRDNKIHSYDSGTRKQHGKTTPVVLIGAGVRVAFDSELDAAKHLGVSAGSVHSARTRNHNCCGYRVEAA